ncbi:fungal specific transcription factor domain-containing protein [Sporobolomyces koalae]|uniref:fungal specific transcription factor domain-containing protein n=1 Tax=Sporobolomyces koalae TaxID=500713 RepID=UPI00316AFCD3
MGTFETSTFQLLRLENNFLLASSTKQAVSAAPLPTPHQAHLAICFYSSSVNPTFRLLYEPNFFRDCQAFWTSGEIPSPTWLALYLAVCSAGFQVIATDQEALSQSGLDEDFTRRLAEKCWKESRETLEDEGFPITPAIEMIQVALVLAFAALSNSSTSISRTVALLGGAASAARAASLYVDPSDLSKTITPLEAEMRRRMFWALYTCEAYAHRMLDLIIAREFSSLCSPDPSVRRPLFLSNDCYTPTGHLSPPGLAATNHGAASSTATPIFTVASLVAKISWLIASDRASPSGSTVASLLDEMASFDGAFRQSSIAETMFRAAFVRLFHTSRDLELAGQSNNTRAVAPRYLHALLQSVSLEPDMARESMPFCMTLVMSAAVRSCITPVEGEIEDLRQFAAFLNIPSRIKVYGLPAARCASMLNALIGDTRPSSSIASPSLGGSSLATPSDATLPSPAVNSTLDVLDSHAHFQDFLRVVPLEAQQSFENGSLQIDQTYSAPQPSTAPAPLRKLAPPSRPLLGLRTSLPLDGMKGTTPILPNWQDASETPSRYVGYSWNANLF